MRTAVSAARTCGAPRSASEYTATVRRPASRAERSTRMAISPRLATRTDPKVIAASHPEDAEAGRRERGPGGHRQGHPQHPPGVHRVDDAVVPQSRGRVVGRALVFVLLADGPFELVLVLGRPAATPRFDRVPAHGGQDRGRLLAAHDRDAGV